MNLKYLEVIDSSLLKKVFEFRYKVITTTKIFQEYAKYTNFENEEEADVYDSYSEHFAVLDKDENICASVRLIHNSKLGYPTENSMKFDNSKFKRKHLGEISRIFIDKKYRNPKISKEIINGLNKLLYVKMIKLDIRYTYGSLKASFVRLLKMNNMNYELLSDLQHHGKMGLRHPTILYTESLGNNNPDLIQALKEKNEQ